MLTKNFKCLSNSEGAIVVESTLIMILVLVVIFSLLYLGIFQVQYSMMYFLCQTIAQEISDCIAFPEYDSLDAYNEISKEKLKSIYSIINPYRYLGGIDGGKYQGKNRDIVNNAELLSVFKAGVFSANIELIYENLSYGAAVTLDYYYNLPKFVEMIGLDSKMLVQTKAVAFSNDSAEFVRNIDLTVDLANELLEKYNLKDKFEVFYEKIKGNKN